MSTGLRRDIEAEWNHTYEQNRVVLNESFFHVPYVEELASVPSSKGNCFG